MNWASWQLKLRTITSRIATISKLGNLAKVFEPFLSQGDATLRYTFHKKYEDARQLARWKGWVEGMSSGFHCECHMDNGDQSPLVWDIKDAGVCRIAMWSIALRPSMLYELLFVKGFPSFHICLSHCLSLASCTCWLARLSPRACCNRSGWTMTTEWGTACAGITWQSRRNGFRCLADNL